MPTLHTINKSPFERNSLEACLRVAVKGSSVLLFEDGVYAAAKGTSKSSMVQDAMSTVTFYALAPDLEARGVDKANVIDGIKLIDYAGFVDLAAENDRVNAWL